MKIQTLSILCGTSACNARCPYCVSKMTPSQGVDHTLHTLNWRNLAVANTYARDNGVSTVLLTGKGEPTLYPDQITEILEHLQSAGYPFIELQSNGIALADHPDRYAPYLKRWYDLGLTTLAISVVHYEPAPNRAVFLPHREHYIDLPQLIHRLHAQGLSVRLSVVLHTGGIDDASGVEAMADWARELKVEQVSIRPVSRPEHSSGPEVHAWATEHALAPDAVQGIMEHLDRTAHRLMVLPHGAIVYDLHGQNLCLTNALTLEPDADYIRQLIFFPDGHLRYDWQYEGAILL